MLGPKQRYFQGVQDKISSEQLIKLEKVQPFGHSKASKIKKKVPHIAHLTRPGESDPYEV